ncbi:MAG: transposase [Flavobacterium sp.]
MKTEMRTHYSKEFKLKAVELVIQRGNLLSVARELNIGKETLRNWKKAYASGKLTTESSGTKTRSEEQKELIRLKKQLYDVTLERDILKKAVGIFSKSDR